MLLVFQLIFFFLKIVIEGVRGQSYKGDIAIDDLWIDDSPCPPAGIGFQADYRATTISKAARQNFSHI